LQKELLAPVSKKSKEENTKVKLHLLGMLILAFGFYFLLTVIHSEFKGTPQQVISVQV
jgi:hypothetical protein